MQCNCGGGHTHRTIAELFIRLSLPLTQLSTPLSVHCSPRPGSAVKLDTSPTGSPPNSCHNRYQYTVNYKHIHVYKCMCNIRRESVCMC